MGRNRKESNDLIEREIFSQSIESCRKIVFDITYADVTGYTGIADSTMNSYDAWNVSPYISVAKQIADLYCCDLDHLCNCKVGIYAFERIKLQTQFIRRIGGCDTKPYIIPVIEEVSKHISVTKDEIYRLVSIQFIKIICDLHKAGKCITISRDMAVAENFTVNFNCLLGNSAATYRKLAAAMGMSLGNITRLKNGSEPMLSGALKIAKYFGISLEQLVSPNPDFNFTEINASVMRNNKAPVTYSPQKAEDVLAKEFSKTCVKSYTPKQAVKVVNKLFEEVDERIVQ